MDKYNVTFTQNFVYAVEANDETEAENKAYELFQREMQRPIANTHYDEVSVDCTEWEE